MSVDVDVFCSAPKSKAKARLCPGERQTEVKGLRGEKGRGCRKSGRTSVETRHGEKKVEYKVQQQQNETFNDGRSD